MGLQFPQRLTLFQHVAVRVIAKAMGFTVALKSAMRVPLAASLTVKHKEIRVIRWAGYINDRGVGLVKFHRKRPPLAVDVCILRSGLTL